MADAPPQPGPDPAPGRWPDLLAGRRWRMLVGGELVDAVDGGLLDVLNPATGEVVARVPSGTAADVDRAVAAARSAFPAWSRTGAEARAERVRELAAAIEEHGEELARLDTVDIGSPIRVTRGDHRMAVAQLRYFAGLALQLRGETIPAPEAADLNLTVREPFGVVGRIVPFNHPLLFAAAKLGAPLVAGNTVVLAPSPHAPLSALRLAELARSVFPPGVVNIVSGVGEVVGDRLVTHPDVPRISFTGGSALGQHVQRRAAEVAVKVVTLELGGKNPMIVFPDADLDAAVAGAVRGMNFTWQGQSCGSTSRLYVHRSVLDPFVARLREAMEALVVGDPTDEATDVGSMSTPAQYAKARHYLDVGRRSPARLVTGGLPDDPGLAGGLFVRPTLFAHDGGADIDLAAEEIFGPILVVMPFDDYDEVVAEANRLPLGLTASVWTRDLGTALRAARDVEAGYLWVNASSTHLPGTPFGGVKNSGLGREEGIEELYSFTYAKNVFVKVL